MTQLTDVCPRFEPQFLEERSQALQAFLMRILAEIPVTSSDATMEFLEVTLSDWMSLCFDWWGVNILGGVVQYVTARLEGTWQREPGIIVHFALTALAFSPGV